VISHTQNPFPESDADRREIWTMLVERDIDAFLTIDWSMVDSDFRWERFLDLHADESELPDNWRFDFPDMETYRDEWLRQAKATQAVEYAEPVRDALFRASNLRDIDLKGNAAVCHKKFDGTIALAGGGIEVTNWQTLYFCARTMAAGRSWVSSDTCRSRWAGPWLKR
jgi:hypothetical protein